MLIIMNKSIHQEILAQPMQNKNEQFKNAVTLLTSHNGVFNNTEKKIFRKTN